jgi:transposase-like protein
MRSRRPRSAAVARSAFAGFCFPPDVIVLAVRWYLRFALSYRDVEELLAERGVQVDHVTIYRWVQRFTPLLAEAARPCRHAVGDRWQVDETYVKVAGRWRYVCRAIDQFGQVIDVFVSPRRDAAAARRFFEWALGATKIIPVEVITDQAATYPVVLEELLPAAWHRTDRYANNGIECDHGRLKARLGPMRGLKQDRSARVVIAGHGFVQDLQRGHYELAVEEPVNQRGGGPVRRARLGDLNPGWGHGVSLPCADQTQQSPQESAAGPAFGPDRGQGRRGRTARSRQTSSELT